jgi:hypothetical protein
MIRQAPFEVPVEHVDDFHGDLHARLPGRHREREAFAGDSDLRPLWTLDLAARQRAERPLQLEQEFGRFEKIHNLLFSQREDPLRVLSDLEGGFHNLTSCSFQPSNLARRSSWERGHLYNLPAFPAMDEIRRGAKRSRCL